MAAKRNTGKAAKRVPRSKGAGNSSIGKTYGEKSGGTSPGLHATNGGDSGLSGPAGEGCAVAGGVASQKCNVPRGTISAWNGATASVEHPLASVEQSQLPQTEALASVSPQIQLQSLMDSPSEAFQQGLARVVRSRLVEVAGELGERGAATEFVALVGVFRKVEGLEAKDSGAKLAPLVNPVRSITRTRGRVVDLAEDFGGLE